MTNKRAVFFFILSFAGLVTAWYFNALAVMNAQDYLQAWFANEVDWVLSRDLTIVAIAGVTFMIYEAKRLGMKRVWLDVSVLLRHARTQVGSPKGNVRVKTNFGF